MLKSSIDITESDLKDIENLASLFFTPKEIAMLLEIDEMVIMQEMADARGDMYRSFQCGRLQSEMELRKAIVKLARVAAARHRQWPWT